MTGERNDYSHYTGILSNLIGGLYFAAGFTFTAITLLLTFQTQTSLFFQITLFIMNIIVDLSFFLAQWYTTHSTLYAAIPPLTGFSQIANYLTFLVASLTTIVPTLLFFVYGFVYLGIASAIQWIAMLIAAYLFIYRQISKKTIFQKS
ncbi:MAG: hypothetical protein ABSF24_00975 [Candidatus Bathyarchaeia archaeon]